MNNLPEKVSRNASFTRQNLVLPMRAEDLRYAPDGVALLHDVSLQIAEGGVSMILGANGAGKSILMRILHGLITPHGGRVLWRGGEATDAVRRRQAMVFQKPVLLRRSVAANMEHALKAAGVARGDRGPRIEAALQEAGIAHLAKRPARVLSGGEQQRLAVARALSLRPDVLFLDEPTASLDPASTAAIEALILAADRRGCKVVMISHDLHQAQRLAGEIVFMDRGRITEQSAAETFFEQPASTAARDFLAGRLHLPDGTTS
ncbi:ATP-binding cassette domain-containing protein [Nisaea acidiphila]|uniref:ATP-binding cassette domain-containing protein n=1 Tax=Nisaea acidiphila TaxID=1862145 RepID=A0A9J7AXK0_9PROT|nr:ATP-binding cassette domain-containing protein [Nisaea acidiphila]UUX52016.1 ATP-binding cassette domain-containing protein [Nisaea acidiphila]